MPKTTFAGHPLHPQVVIFPAALLPFAGVLDVLYWLTGKAGFAQSAYYSLIGGLIGGVAAASTGAPDYLDIPPDTEAKKIGTLHAGLNATLLGMTVLNILLRKKRPEAPGGVPVALSLVGSAGIFVSAWYGGDLVYTHGIRVQDSGEGGSELAPPGGEKVEEVFRRVARSLPGSHEGM